MNKNVIQFFIFVVIALLEYVLLSKQINKLSNKNRWALEFILAIINVYVSGFVLKLPL